MNVMDPDRVFKGAEFNLLLAMKGRGHGKCRMGGTNIGGLLTVLPPHFSSQLAASAAFCTPMAQKPSASPLPARGAAGSHPHGSAQGLPYRPRARLTRAVFSFAGSGSTACLKTLGKAEVVCCWCFLVPLFASRVKGTSTYRTGRQKVLIKSLQNTLRSLDEKKCCLTATCEHLE